MQLSSRLGYFIKKFVLFVCGFLKLASGNKGSMIHGEIPSKYPLVNTASHGACGQLGPHVTIDTGMAHAAQPPSPLILEFHFKNERQLHVILSCRRHCRPRTMGPDTRGGRRGWEGGWVEMEK